MFGGVAVDHATHAAIAARAARAVRLRLDAANYKDEARGLTFEHARPLIRKAVKLERIASGLDTLNEDDEESGV